MTTTGKQNVKMVAYRKSESVVPFIYWLKARLTDWAASCERAEELKLEPENGRGLPIVFTDDHHKRFDHWLRLQYLIASFTSQYIATMLWSENDEDDNPLDENYSIDDLAPYTLQQIIADCRKFQEANAKYITDNNVLSSYSSDTNALAGHNFWLTRNSHGAGFWDGDWREVAAIALTDSAKSFGESHVFVQDGKLIVE